jgi:hypothetical protein
MLKIKATFVRIRDNVKRSGSGMSIIKTFSDIAITQEVH